MDGADKGPQPVSAVGKDHPHHGDRRRGALIMMKFDTLGVSEVLAALLQRQGIMEPTPVQEH